MNRVIFPRAGGICRLRRRIFTSSIVGPLTRTNPSVGEYVETTHTFCQDDVKIFGGLCGDNNPIHIDPEYAKNNSIFKGTIVHGIFVSSLFSTLFGRSITGSIYVSQSLNFKRPVYVGTPVRARMEIKLKEDKKKGYLLTCTTQCFLEDDTLAVDGEAKVLVPK